jgi:hypothetical protein
MEPLIHLFVLLFGFIFGFIFYELTRYRIGGVVAIPIMVIYTMDNPLMLPIFGFSTVVCLLAVHIIEEETLLYGRRLLYLNLAVSIVTTSLIFFYASSVLNINLTALTVGTIFPGIIAFNISRESYDLENTLKAIIMMLANFLIVLLFALALTLAVGWPS